MLSGNRESRGPARRETQIEEMKDTTDVRATVAAGKPPEVTTVQTGRVWKGTAFGGARGPTDVPKIVDWYMRGKIEIDPMITHVMPLAEINNAFELMKRGESVRGVVTF